MGKVELSAAVLTSALEVGDWPRINGCRARMEEMDRHLLRGRCTGHGDVVEMHMYPVLFN